ncbi:hypothetical protein WJX75_009025 [Coccomyxa subellipsoidea]|uniref:BZIP domain-containing protein n=1 Tax=Coccomyxa subellipsoidea TaxID=248742 RepID=A0ABR2Z5M8_9CHLO
METPLLGDAFLGDETLIPSLHDDADLLQFLDGLDRHFSAPCPSDESSFEEVLRHTGAMARMCASKSLPDLPMAGKAQCTTESSGIRRKSAEFTAVDFLKPQRGLTRVDSDVSNRSIAQASEISSSVITERWPAERLKRPSEAYLQDWDVSWGHSGIQDHGFGQGQQAHLYDRVVPNIPATTGPVASAPLFNSEPSVLNSAVTLSLNVEASQEKSAESCSSFETQPKLGQKRKGAASRGRAKNTEGWRDKNRRIQKAFRERQKEKQRATEIAIEEMSERVDFLEAENRQLQKTLEDATHTVKRSKAVAKDCSSVAVAVTCGSGDAPVRLTSTDLQAFNVDRLVSVWGGLVRNMAVLFPEAVRQPQGRHASRLEALAGECCALMWALVDVNPAVLASFINCDIEAAAPRQDISPDMWPSILERLHLSPQQCAELADTRRAMLSNVGALRTEREQLRAQAQAMAWLGGNGALLAADEAGMVDQLQSNVEAMQLCTAYYISHAYTEVLTPMQCACFFHQCYPLGPDLMSLMAAAASAANEPRTADIFRAAHTKSSGFGASAEWRKALVLPLSRLRCATA